MYEITSFIEWILNIITENLYVGVFIATLLETIFPPIPSEAIFPLAGYIILQNGQSFEYVILVSIIGGTGATLGSIVFYVIALKLGRVGILRFGKKLRITPDTLNKADKWFKKYGDKSVFLCRLVPGLREIISIPAGLFNMKFYKFVLFTFAGSTIWSFILTSIGYYFATSTIDLFSF